MVGGNLAWDWGLLRQRPHFVLSHLTTTTVACSGLIVTIFFGFVAHFRVEGTTLKKGFRERVIARVDEGSARWATPPPTRVGASFQRVL